MIRILPLLALLIVFIAAKPVPQDSVDVTHNPSLVVEQQSSGGGICHTDGDYSDCVTNTGDCVWDADDVLQASAHDGHLELCHFADWQAHSYRVLSTGHFKRDDLTIHVTLDPPLDLVGDGTSELVEGWTFTDWTRLQGKWAVASGCFEIDLDHEYPDYVEIPHQGGRGKELGMAVPLTITVESEGTITVAKRGLERCWA